MIYSYTITIVSSIDETVIVYNYTDLLDCLAMLEFFTLTAIPNLETVMFRSFQSKK